MRFSLHLENLGLEPLLVKLSHSFLVERVDLVADEPQNALTDLVELPVAEDA